MEPFLPDGYTLIQESETRFGTDCQVIERFLKSKNKAAIHFGTRTVCAAATAYTGLRKTSNVDGTM